MIRLKKSSIVRGTNTVLELLDLVLNRGTVTGILGKNGSGKTSLLRVLAGLDPSQYNDLFLDSESYQALGKEARARSIGWSSSTEQSAFDYMVKDYLLFGRYPHNQGRNRSEDLNIVRRSMDEVGMAHEFLDRPMSTLSQGETQKIRIARLLTQEVEVFLMDEPFANLDPSSCIEIGRVFAKIAAKGKVVCLSIHDLPLAWRVCDEVRVLGNRQLLAAGKKDLLIDPLLMKQAFGVSVRVATDESGTQTLVF